MRNLLLASSLFTTLLTGTALADDAKPAGDAKEKAAPPAATAKEKPAVPAADGKAKPPAKPAPVKPITVKLSDAAGKSIGTAKLAADPGGVKITLAVKGLTAGEHAIHIHEAAKCDGPDFKSAGGHFNPEHKKHGKDNPEGPHAGDMPNFTVDAKGGSKASVVAPGITLDDGAHGVFASGGTALVIHAKADDGKTDPAGAAGDRIACGLIVKK